MSRAIPMLRLTPQAAGTLQQQYTKAIKELHDITRRNREFDRQLRALIGNNRLRDLHKATDDALLLADLVKEAA
ncbi:hypothetical protein [Pseudomonas veronii]|uniref:hypothetical protein n=1 Tax=Pseudomonas veronii TaxID=76761 RepID=UPI000F82B303|nr:hypothetical protein [Pseudomonas veronii]RTY63552.1 hypothetical protein EKA83_33115 [Pseudomonas veronii]